MKITFKSEKQINPEKNDGFDVNYAPAKRLAFKARWYFLVSLILSPILFFAWHIVDQEVLVTADGILTTEPIELEASQDAYVKKIHVRVGDKIQKELLLIELSAPEIEQELALLERKHKSMKLHYKTVISDLKKLYLKQLVMLKVNKTDRKVLEEKFEEYEKKGAIGISEQLLIDQSMIDSESSYQQAVINFEQDITSHELLLKQELLELELAITAAKSKVKQLNIYPPKQAVVNKVLVKEGEFVSTGVRLISISNLPQPIVNVYLPPERMDYAQIGQTATITLPNGEKYQGVIEQPTLLTERLPAILTGVFDSATSAIKVTLTISPVPDISFEGLPVEVRFHYLDN